MHSNDPRPLVEYFYALNRRPRRGGPSIAEARRDFAELRRAAIAMYVP